MHFLSARQASEAEPAPAPIEVPTEDVLGPFGTKCLSTIRIFMYCLMCLRFSMHVRSSAQGAITLVRPENRATTGNAARPEPPQA